MNLFPVVLFLSCALCGMAAALGMAVCRLRHQEQSKVDFKGFHNAFTSSL